MGRGKEEGKRREREARTKVDIVAMGLRIRRKNMYTPTE